MTERSAAYPLKVQMGPVTADPHFTVRCLTCGFAHDSPKGTNAEAQTEFYARHQCPNPQYSSEAIQP